MIYIRLFLEFCKTGLFSIGGGLATLPFLYEMSNKTHWFTHADIADMIAVSESTPGAIGINMSTYAGYLVGGYPGGILATISLAFAPCVIILVISRFLDKFRQNPLVDNAFYGLRPASLAMISAAGLNVAKIALVNISAFAASHKISDLFLWKAILLGAAIYFVQKKWNVHPIGCIAASAAIGILFRFAGA